MENAFLFVTGISDGSCLACVAAAECDVGLVGYEMAVLVEKAGAVLTPELRAELQSSASAMSRCDGDELDEAVRRSASVRTCSRRVGRARPSTCPLETLVKVTPQGVSAAPRLALERKKIVSLCNAPISIAEVSAHLSSPSASPGCSWATWPKRACSPATSRNTPRPANVPT